MRALLTRDEARAMDRAAAEELGLPTLVLMENAGRGAAEVILGRHREHLGHVLVVGGVGQNGGDAWVVARHLLLAGVRASCFLVSPDGGDCVGDAAVMVGVARRMRLEVARVERELEAFEAALGSATLVVDGLFGTGLSRPIEGVHAAVVERIVASSVPVVSLDLPSGIDANDGSVLGVAIRATTTVTFGGEKRGLHTSPGLNYAGAVVVASIGAPLASPSSARILETSDVVARLPVRAKDAHKGTAGHVLVVGGSRGTTGAALLSARGALRAGAGLVTIAARPEARASFDARVLEAMTREYGAVAELLGLCVGRRSVVVGPGLGLHEHAREVAIALALGCSAPLVVDADALTHIGELGLSELRKAPGLRVLTPHPGEAARLLGISTAGVQADRFAAARRLAEESGQVVVLKGARSIVASPGRPSYVCDRGTPALGIGGSGDVLSGVVAAVVEEQEPALDVAAAVTWHALAGEAAAVTDRGVLASEVADALPGVLAGLRG